MLQLYSIVRDLPSFIYLMPRCCQKAAFWNFSLIFLIIQKEKASHFLLRKPVRGTHCHQNLLCGNALLQPSVARFSPAFLLLHGLSFWSVVTALWQPPSPFSICHVYLTGQFVLLHNVPGADRFHRYKWSGVDDALGCPSGHCRPVDPWWW